MAIARRRDTFDLLLESKMRDAAEMPWRFSGDSSYHGEVMPFGSHSSAQIRPALLKPHSLDHLPYLQEQQGNPAYLSERTQYPNMQSMKSRTQLPENQASNAASSGHILPPLPSSKSKSNGMSPNTGNRMMMSLPSTNAEHQHARNELSLSDSAISSRIQSPSTQASLHSPRRRRQWYEQRRPHYDSHNQKEWNSSYSPSNQHPLQRSPQYPATHLPTYQQQQQQLILQQRQHRTQYEYDQETGAKRNPGNSEFQLNVQEENHPPLLHQPHDHDHHQHHYDYREIRAEVRKNPDYIQMQQNIQTNRQPLSQDIKTFQPDHVNVKANYHDMPWSRPLMAGSTFKSRSRPSTSQNKTDVPYVENEAGIISTFSVQPGLISMKVEKETEKSVHEKSINHIPSSYQHFEKYEGYDEPKAPFTPSFDITSVNDGIRRAVQSSEPKPDSKPQTDHPRDHEIVHSPYDPDLHGHAQQEKSDHESIQLLDSQQMMQEKNFLDNQPVSNHPHDDINLKQNIPSDRLLGFAQTESETSCHHIHERSSAQFCHGTGEDDAHTKQREILSQLEKSGSESHQQHGYMLQTLSVRLNHLKALKQILCSEAVTIDEASSLATTPTLDRRILKAIEHAESINDEACISDFLRALTMMWSAGRAQGQNKGRRTALEMGGGSLGRAEMQGLTSEVALSLLPHLRRFLNHRFEDYCIVALQLLMSVVSKLGKPLRQLHRRNNASMKGTAEEIGCQDDGVLLSELFQLQDELTVVIRRHDVCPKSGSLARSLSMSISSLR